MTERSVVEAESRFRALFQKAYPALGRYFSYRGLSKADADDLVAATLEVAWRRLDQVPDDDPLPWLFTVARNLLRNHRRSAYRASVFLSRVPVPLAVPGPGDVDVPVSALLTALEQLGDEDRELLLLVAWDGLSPTQASIALGCTPVAARSRLHRARRRLASELDLATHMQRPGGRRQIAIDGAAPTTSVEVPDD